MNTKKLILAMTLLWGLFAWTAKADVTKKIGSSDGGTTLSPGADYKSMTAAFAALNGFTGVVNLQIIDNTTETGTIYYTKNASTWTTLNIYPTVTGKTISGNISGPLFNLTAVSGMVIDGRLHNADGSLNGSTRDLTITNTGGANVLGAVTIRLEGNSSGNTIKYCTIKGSGTANYRGIICILAGATLATGNGNNTISNNLFTCADNAKRPTWSIYSSGTSAAFPNNNLTITDNEFADFLSTNAGQGTGGAINLGASTSACTITGNSFYETTLFAPTASALTCSVITVSNGSGTGFNISNNYIGGSAALCAGLNPFRKTNAFDNVFYAINVTVGGTPVTTVTNNTIQKFDWGNSANAMWTGINIGGAAINVTGNTIGATTGNGSINYTGAGATNAQFYGINFAQSATSAGTGNCSNNNIGSITMNTVPSTIYGLFNGSAGTTYFQNNIIGSTTTANSINAAGTGALAHNFMTIRQNGAGNTTISGNTIANITNSATTGSQIQVMLVGAGTNTINGNFIYNIFSPNSTSAAKASMTGINFSGSAASSTSTLSNNIISLGGDAASNIIGIQEANSAATATTNVYFNTIYVGGSEISGSTAKSYCLTSSGGVNKNIKNNVLVNTRSTVGGSSQHYAFSASAPSGTFVCNYNDYFVSGVGSKLGYYGGADKTTSVIVTGQDVNSKAVDPSFTGAAAITAGTAAVADYKPTYSTSLAGTAISGLTTDYATTARTIPTMGAYEIPTPVPTITGAATATTFTTTYGTASAAQIFSVSGSNLTANLVATAPTGFEVASDGAIFGITATFTKSGASASGTLSVRLKASATVAGTYNALNIVLSSDGATSVNIVTAASGNAVTAKALTITASGPPKIYGSALSTGTSTTNFSTNGTEVSGEVVTGVTLTPDAAGISVNTTAGASYVVAPTLATGTGNFLASNYNITYSPYNGKVAQKALTITATGPSKTYGTALSVGTSTTNFTHSGEASGEVVTGVTLTPDAAGVLATTAAGAGYVITPSLATGSGGFLASNYDITYSPYNGTVAQKALTITATGLSKTYGTVLSAGTSASNFTTNAAEISGETVSSVTLTPNAAGLLATTAAGASYVVAPSLATGTGGFLASNYDITYSPYNGTVAQKALTITATGPTKTYGTALSAGTSASNFSTNGAEVSAEVVSSVTLTPNAVGLSATTAAGAGYVVAPSLATGTGGFLASNYDITYSPYNGMVAQKALTITATGPSKTYGTALSAGASASNFSTNAAEVSGEVIDGVTLTPDAAGISSSTAAGAAYVVTPSLATGTSFTASNYYITYNAYNGTVDPSAPNAPTIGTATAGNAQASVAFTAPVDNGGSTIIDYTATSSPSGGTGTLTQAGSGTITVTGLTNGTAYTFTVTARNSVGSSSASSASNSITPIAPNVTVANTETKTPTDLGLTPSSVVTVASGGTLNIDATTTVSSLTVASGGKLNVEAAKPLTVGTLTLTSGIDGSATTVKLDANITATTVRLFKTIDEKKWYFMSFPFNVVIANITKSNGDAKPTLNLGLGDLFIKYYDGAHRGTDGTGSNWKHFVGAELIANQGYIFGLSNTQSEMTLSFPLSIGGTLAADVNRNIAVAENPSTQANDGGWNLIGQPFLSKFIASHAVGDYDLYVYDGVLNNYTPVAKAAAIINPFSAYFIQASHALAGSGISFVSATGRQLSPSVAANEIMEEVQLDFTSSTGSDYALLRMDNSFSTAYEIGHDLEKWIGTGTPKPQIYTSLGSVNYAFNALPMTSVVNLPLGIYTQTAGITTIHAAGAKAPSLSKLLLTDNSTNPVTVTDLLTSSYTFTAAAGTDNSRFAITAQRVPTSSLVDANSDENAPKLSIVNCQLSIENLSPNSAVRVFDALGRLVANKTLSNNSLEIKLSAKGMYTVQIEAGGKSWVKKIVN